MEIYIEKSVDRYPKCNFCLSVQKVNQIQSDKSRLCISVCEDCLNEIYKNKPTYE